jgi:hypothetical protein
MAEKIERPTLLGETDEDVPKDRDQSAYSPERAHDKADQAEYSQGTEVQSEAVKDESLVSKDNMKAPAPRKGSL